MNETYLYPWSAEEAHRRDELPLWWASHQANIACRLAELKQSEGPAMGGMTL